MDTTTTGGAGIPVNPNPNQGLDPAALLQAVQGKLLEQSGMVSSTNSDLQNSLQKAMSGVQTATDKTGQAIESSYNRQITDAQQTGADQIQNGRAAGAGGVLNIGALRAVTQTIDKNVNDLEQRKNELMLQNDAAGAAKVADMQLEALKFKQQASQQTFANLLSMGDYGVKLQQQQLNQKAQTLQETQAISSVALKYGLKVEPGDTLASITTKAMPFASKEQQLSLAKMQAEINSANAQAAKYMSDVNASKSGLDALSASVLAANYMNGDPTSQTAILTSILNSKSPQDMAIFQGALQTSQADKAKQVDALVPELAKLNLNQIDKQLAVSPIKLTPDEAAQLKTKVAMYKAAHPDVVAKGLFDIPTTGTKSFPEKEAIQSIFQAKPQIKLFRD